MGTAEPFSARRVKQLACMGHDTASYGSSIVGNVIPDDTIQRHRAVVVELGSGDCELGGGCVWEAGGRSAHWVFSPLAYSAVRVSTLASDSAHLRSEHSSDLSLYLE